MPYTTQDFVDSVKTRVFVPISQNTITDSDILIFADEELQTNLVPMIMGVREDYFVTSLSTSTTAVNQYNIPTRAIGLKLKDVTFLDTAGNETPLTRYASQDSHVFVPNFNYNPNTNSYTIRGNKIIIMGTFTGGSTLKMYYFLRPNKLVLPTECAQITAITVSSNTITVSSLPSTFLANTTVDLLKQNPGNDTLLMDATISSIAGTAVTLSSLPTDLAVGDYMALSEEAPVIQVPRDLYPLLAQMVEVKILEALGDSGGLVQANKKLKEMKETTLNLIAPRVEGSAKKLINRFNPINYITRNNRWRY